MSTVPEDSNCKFSKENYECTLLTDFSENHHDMSIFCALKKIGRKKEIKLAKLQ